jgi:DNA-binding beta-propeller fold protein YncE
VLFVSNINGKPTDKDDNGYISKLDTEGKILSKKWAEGLHAPKGMVIANGYLYVTDIDRIAKIDIQQGTIVKYISVEGSSFLNDMEVLDNKIYVSDMAAAKIFVLDRDEVAVFKDQGLKRPNGMLTSGPFLLNGNQNFILKINPQTMESSRTEAPVGGIDGLKAYDSSTFLTSDWKGNVHKVSHNGEATLILSTEAEDVQAADFEYIGERKLLLIPTFFHNTVAAYRLQ